MKNNRLFGIIYLLLSKDTITARELSDYFEVSTRTIYRDIESLSELNIPIYMSKGKNGGISLLNNYKLDKAMLTDEEQNQILFSLEGINKLQINNSNIYEKMKTIFSKNEDNWFEVDFSVWENSDIHREYFEIIKNAIINKNIIEFLYYNSYGATSIRIVEPLKLCFKHNSWHLYGFDKGKGDFRLFKIMRIKDLKSLNEIFEREIPNQIPLFTEEPKLVKLVLQIDKKLSYRVYDEFKDSEIKILENGNFLITVEFPYNDWIYGYILSFGEHIKVLEPDNIRNEIINKLNNSLKNYF